MHSLSIALAFTAILSAAYTQTPPGTLPSTESPLSVFYGTIQDSPGRMLPLSVVKTLPTISYPSANPNQIYQALLVDLSIKDAQLNVSSLAPGIQFPLTQGIITNRTTRVHYWQPGLTFTSNGTLINTTLPIAYYQPPAPPPGDIAHTYVFYLFEQTALFGPPPPGNPFSQALINVGMGSRYSFNVNHLAAENGTGPLVGATYFTAQNTTGAVTGSATTGSITTPTVVPFMGEARRVFSGVGGAIMAVIAALIAS